MLKLNIGWFPVLFLHKSELPCHKMVKRIVNKVKSEVNRLRCTIQVPYHHILSVDRNIILMYHGVCKEPNPFNKRHTYLTDFERQIKYLSKCANVISIEDFFVKRFDSKRINVAITFDDGYLNNLNFALPVLDKYGVKASFYITGLAHSDEKIIWADFLQIACFFRKENFELGGDIYIIEMKQALRKSDRKPLLEIIKNEKPEYSFKKELYSILYDDFSRVSEITSEFWKLMNDEQIKTLASSPLVTIGSHGWQHNNLGNIEKDHAGWELRQSKEYLENLIQKSVDEIAFPDGSYSATTLSQCKELGYRYMLATEVFMKADNHSDVNLKQRFGIYQIGSWSDQIIFNRK